MRPPLHENRHRYYDPYTGTYLQVDPKVEDTWEAYNYVEQNPVISTDPTGETECLGSCPGSHNNCKRETQQVRNTAQVCGVVHDPGSSCYTCADAAIQECIDCLSSDALSHYAAVALCYYIAFASGCGRPWVGPPPPTWLGRWGREPWENSTGFSQEPGVEFPWARTWEVSPPASFEVGHRSVPQEQEIGATLGE